MEQANPKRNPGSLNRTESADARKRRLKLTRIGAIFTLLVPLPVIVVIPWYITRWSFQPAFFGLEALRYLGAVMIVAGLITYSLGIGHLGYYGSNPIPPVANIVSEGIYQWTRNPMYTGVVTMLTGQAMVFGSHGMLYYALGWFLFFHTFEVVYDEPALKKQFADVYPDYCRNTPRWIPRRPRSNRRG
jgi:protein-S-isoprenylcysteine O-methyltransferase Ste14